MVGWMDGWVCASGFRSAGQSVGGWVGRRVGGWVVGSFFLTYWLRSNLSITPGSANFEILIKKNFG